MSSDHPNSNLVVLKHAEQRTRAMARVMLSLYREKGECTEIDLDLNGFSPTEQRLYWRAAYKLCEAQRIRTETAAPQPKRKTADQLLDAAAEACAGAISRRMELELERAALVGPEADWKLFAAKVAARITAMPEPAGRSAAVQQAIANRKTVA